MDVRGSFHVHLPHVTCLLHLAAINTTAKICDLTYENLIEKNVKYVYSWTIKTCIKLMATYSSYHFLAFHPA
jgi:hypothetical protein